MRRLVAAASVAALLLSGVYAAPGGSCSNAAVSACPAGGECRVLVLGDSQSSLNDSSYDLWTEQLEAELVSQLGGGCVTVVNTASPGQTTTGADGFWQTAKAPQNFDILITWIGHNDMVSGGDTAANTLTRIDAIHAAANTDSMTVYNLGTFPWKNGAGWTSGYQTTLDTYRTDLAADGTINYLDAYDTLEDPANADELLAAYDNGDGVHLNQAGHNAIAALVEAAVLQ